MRHKLHIFKSMPIIMWQFSIRPRLQSVSVSCMGMTLNVTKVADNDTEDTILWHWSLVILSPSYLLCPPTKLERWFLAYICVFVYYKSNEPISLKLDINFWWWSGNEDISHFFHFFQHCSAFLEIYSISCTVIGRFSWNSAKWLSPTCDRSPTGLFTQNGRASAVDSTADFLNSAQLPPMDVCMMLLYRRPCSTHC